MSNNQTERLVVLHIITGLRYGGAEMMLLKLLRNTDRSSMRPIVVSLTDIGSLGSSVRELGVDLFAMNLRLANPQGMFRLIRLIRQVRPDIVQTWMYHSDLLGGVLARLSGVQHIVWNIRNSGLSPSSTKIHTRLTVWLCGLLSRLVPSVILTNSHVAASNHSKRGYDAKKLLVIPNGFDHVTYRSDASARLAVRKELEVDEDATLIGLIARYNPQKNHKGFLEAAAMLSASRDNTFFVLVGPEVDSENCELSGLIRSSKLEGNVFLLGKRQDVPRILASLDICTLSSSYGEAFPNIVGEAMCCEVPVVATDVGDTALIVGEAGEIVRPGHVASLLSGWRKVLAMTDDERKTLGEKGRERIIDQFDIGSVCKMYEQLYTRLSQTHH